MIQFVTAAAIGWRTIHPRRWSPDQVLDWVYSSETLPGVDHGALRGEAFNRLPGAELVALNRAEFVAREPLYGDQLYHRLQTLLDSYSTLATAIFLLVPIQAIYR